MFRDCCLITRIKKTSYLQKDRYIINENSLNYHRFTIENKVNDSFIFHSYHLNCSSKNGNSHHISCTKPTIGTMMGDGKHDSMHFLIQEECLVNDNRYTIFLTIAFLKRMKIV